MSILAIKFKQCDEDIKKYCVIKKCYLSCEEALWKCHYPLLMNPLCLNSNINQCRRDWITIKQNDDIYIFYYCNCKHLLKNLEDHYKSILEPIKSLQIYYGSSLEKLEKALIKPKETPPSKDVEYDLIVKCLEEKIVELRC